MKFLRGGCLVAECTGIIGEKVWVNCMVWKMVLDLVLKKSFEIQNRTWGFQFKSAWEALNWVISTETWVNCLPKHAKMFCVRAETNQHKIWKTGRSHQYFHIAHLEINTYSETWKEEVQAAPHFPHGSLLYLLSSKILFSITKLFKFSFFNIRF